MNTPEKVTQADVAAILHYDSGSGLFTWRVNRRGHPIKAGDAAGTPTTGGYLSVRLHGKWYALHRLAWLLSHGAWPTIIDHINGDKRDNRIANLREASPAVNAQNRRSHGKRSPWPMGVTQARGRKTWRAMITIQGKNTSIGHFDSPELAHAAYIKAKRELHEGNTL